MGITGKTETRSRDRKPVGKSESKTKLEPQARPLSEISENESKTKFELNEDSFLVNEAELISEGRT